ncbi:MAG: hypothetical protein IJ702_02875 [Fretibacterium sp.]|nr:hypothetical protein [Fretibacterium sp.]
MKTVLTLGLALAGLSLMPPKSALAHGVGFRQAASPPAALEFFYSTGEAMSYREARVFSPADGTFAHQAGRTDAAGRFAFVPDTPGVWRVIVRDEEGHQATAELEVTEAMLKDGSAREAPVPLAAEGEGNPPEGLELAFRAALGVSLLFNLSAFALLCKRRVAHAHQ